MRSIIKALIRIVIIGNALSYLAYSVNNAVWLFRDGTQALLFSNLTIFILATLLSSLILYFLWRKTDSIVKMVAGDLNENELIINTTNKDLLEVSMRILGMVLLVSTIPSLLGVIAYHFYYANEYPGINYPGELQANEVKNFVSQTITILLGFWLAAGSRPIIKVISNLWNFGKITRNTDTEEKS